jgi:hypothetical protein
LDQLAGGFRSLYDEFVMGEISSIERLQNLNEKDSRRDKEGNARREESPTGRPA